VGADGKVRDATGKVLGTVGVDGQVRDTSGNAIGKIAPGPQTGSLAFDQAGHLIGTVGADGKVRDATGKVLGTVGVDGQVRDTSGNAIGKIAPGPQTGSLAFDQAGHLIGTVGADGKVRDAGGRVVGTVGMDGTVRNTTGKVIGNTAPAAGNVGAAVYDSQGKLIGSVAADGKVHDPSGRVVGTVGADGQVRDTSGNVIGKVVSPTSISGANKLGSLAFDRNGRVIGTVGPDGKVRDANGAIVGAVDSEGTVKDNLGNTIGSVNGTAPGTAVYDPQGKFLGTVGPDGKVRDANRSVVGSVGADGVVRDTQGKAIGRTSYIAPGSAVFGPDGRLIGSVGADGRLVPATLGPGAAGGIAGGVSNATPQEQAAARQQQAVQQQKAHQLVLQLQSAMSGQMSQLISSWAPPTQQFVGGPSVSEGGAAGAGALGEAGKAGTAGGTANTAAFVKAGSIMFAVLDTAVNSDEPGPIMATITEGKLKGGKLLGTMTNQGQNTMLTFNTLSLPGAPSSVPINTVAIDPGTARTALSSDTDNHYMLRYGSLFATSFLSGYAQALTQSGSQTTITVNGIVHQVPEFSARQKVMVALGNVGQQYSSVLGNLFNTPPTVKIYAGTGIGILFLSDMAPPSAGATTTTQS
jgi:hypothetical protein